MNAKPESLSRKGLIKLINDYEEVYECSEITDFLNDSQDLYGNEYEQAKDVEFKDEETAKNFSGEIMNVILNNYFAQPQNTVDKTTNDINSIINRYL